jgi:hypothetical protein
MGFILEHGLPDGDDFDQDLILLAKGLFKSSSQVGCFLSDKHHDQLLEVPHWNKLLPDQFPQVINEPGFNL